MNKTYIRIFVVIIAICIYISIITVFTGKHKTEDVINNNTIETTTIKIDSIVNRNDSIKLDIENIKSIRDAQVIEISNLDNDSTVKLFYKLVKE